MLRTSPFGGRDVTNTVTYFRNPRDFEQTALLSVKIGTEFKTVVFVKLFQTECYVVIGDTTAYDATCYWNNGAKDGIALITKNEEWYSCSASEGNAIYKNIIKTKKISRIGRPYYFWNNFKF